MALKGRHWIATWLLLVLTALWAVVARQTSALSAARELTEFRAGRATLEGRRADLERRIRVATSRAVLVPRAQRLGLRAPADSEIVLLPVPGTPAH
ncbi:MAG: hypothetical protein HYS40_03885 [Gemmatimonadetes bacterium]|nr:hypothetical protein [Gemmatimonadota bacterium]